MACDDGGGKANLEDSGSSILKLERIEDPESLGFRILNPENFKMCNFLRT